MLGDAIASKKHIIVNQVYQNTSFCMYTQTYLQQEHVNEVPEVVWVEIFFVLVNNLIMMVVLLVVVMADNTTNSDNNNDDDNGGDDC